MNNTLPLLQRQRLDELSTNERVEHLVRVQMVETGEVFDYFCVMCKRRSKEIENKTEFNET